MWLHGRGDKLAKIHDCGDAYSAFCKKFFVFNILPVLSCWIHLWGITEAQNGLG